MSQIENAAREIAGHCEFATEAEIAEIIRRHLFPLVKPEDVRDAKLYWVKPGMCQRYYLSNGEIPTTGPWVYYGPIPTPGDT
jgi:hypothetical protein